jgi:hypothetical protein
MRKSLDFFVNKKIKKYFVLYISFYRCFLKKSRNILGSSRKKISIKKNEKNISNF